MQYHQYDALNRLLAAASSAGWSESYGYDGFGNLVEKNPTGGAPTLSQAMNPLTNQIVVQTYDPNGNQTSGGYAYDAENRSVSATGVQYGYDSRNKRFLIKNTGQQRFPPTPAWYGGSHFS